nr:fumarylacetoacetate hydrolase family protein [Thermosulfidibacter takaii]
MRFQAEDKTYYGILEDNNIYVPEQKRFYSLSEIKLLAPSKPSKIVAVALNYKEHAKEMGKPLPEEPLIFIKPNTAVINPYEEIVLPEMSERVDYEGELAIVIGKTAKDVPVESAKDHILGYTCFNDVTARDLQKKDGMFARAKGFDTFAPFGPWIVTDVNPLDLEIKTILNGKVVQKGRTSDMIFNVYELVSFISRIMTLLPGDVIATGTPPGVGPLKSKDTVEVEIKGIGKLTNRVK